MQDRELLPASTEQYTEACRWHKANNRDLGAIETFLRVHEPFLVAAASRFITYTQTGAPPGELLICQNADNTIQSFVFRSGAILHPFFHGCSSERAEKIICRMLKQQFFKKIYSVQGLTEDVRIAERALKSSGYSMRDSFDYYLMNLTETVRLPLKPDGLELVVNPTLEALYQLQAAYEQEEVIPSHGSFSEKHCRQGVERILREELLVYGEYQGLPAAKANTNAASYRYRQIGGVYVRPDLRGLGIGTYVVAALVERIQQTGAAVSLFVKKRNQSAIKVYEKLGFKTIGEYRISYY
ncbi:GNAT family N-acetyltransferase [Gracilinema caldarium]|uniref:GNAT family N-acetyltransferase n=1 Tax=Gracilinema caldarium TaxID=215591 RepID=UPI0026E9682B|nr:GNAT family N-acetyltransferase [Gracilinema caldarium]